MTETDAQFRERCKKALAKVRATQAASYAAVEELTKILDAEPTTGECVKTLFAAWKTGWERRYADAYAFNGAKDGAHFKRLLKTFSCEEIVARMDVFLQSRDPFYLSAKHGLGLFVSTINNHGRGTAAPDLELSAPVIPGCKHTPRCTSDQQHTKRQQADLRRPTSGGSPF